MAWSQPIIEMFCSVQVVYSTFYKQPVIIHLNKQYVAFAYVCSQLIYPFNQLDCSWKKQKTMKRGVEREEKSKNKIEK